MADNSDIIRSRLDWLAELVKLTRLSQSEEDRARVERSIQLVCRAFQAVARGRQQTGNEAHRGEAAEIAALCRRIVEEAREAGLRIDDSDNLR
jgi:hypothetical protein